MTKNEFAPVTPGEMLKEEFLAEYGLSQNQARKGHRHFAEPDSGNRQRSAAYNG